VPDTPVWQELLRLAAGDGLEGIALRHPRGEAHTPGSACFADLTWRGGEVETIRVQDSDGPDELALALALARELGLPRESLQRG
jgi:hypothetical protein